MVHCLPFSSQLSLTGLDTEDFRKLSVGQLMFLDLFRQVVHVGDSPPSGRARSGVSNVTACQPGFPHIIFEQETLLKYYAFDRNLFRFGLCSWLFYFSSQLR
ncbi:hypothetical protein ILYODFUR_036271 [Ilyodon furcidens]|uniref:Uncharacterized protein n=1 Tax=Ilyodon furcidens TaxID=33524 RepID=A0ABV0T342_9TELE